MSDWSANDDKDTEVVVCGSGSVRTARSQLTVQFNTSSELFPWVHLERCLPPEESTSQLFIVSGSRPRWAGGSPAVLP